jgi:signal transduction histidine kinase
MKAMKELRSVQLQLIEAEKMKLVGRLAAGVAHEVKNPLAVVAMGMEYMRNQKFEDPNIEVIVGEITDAVKRADNVVRGLLDFSAPQRLALEPADANGLIRQALMLARGEFTGGNFEIIEELDAALPLVRLDTMKMEQAFVNLFTNAAHAMEGGGKLVVRTSSRQLTGLGENISNFGSFQVGDRLVVAEVLDTGHGLSDASEGKVFEPFFTTKPTGKGTGLGLTVTKTIIDLHGGTIGIRNRPEGGVCVTIILKAEPPL